MFSLCLTLILLQSFPRIILVYRMISSARYLLLLYRDENRKFTRQKNKIGFPNSPSGPGSRVTNPMTTEEA